MTPHLAALDWIKRGFSPIPIPHRSKRPVLEEWQRLEITATDALQYFNSTKQNVGVLLGDKYGSTDVDCDCPEAITAARDLLPETGLIFGRTSKPFSHYFFRTDPPVRTKQFCDPVDGTTLIEMRGLSSNGSIGLQTIVPPSVHKSGEQIRFERSYDRTPANIDADLLARAVGKVAAAALLARHWPKEGSRHSAFLALAGVFSRAAWSQDDAKAFHQAVYHCLWITNADLSAADAEVHSTYKRFTAGDEITGAPTLYGVVDKRIVDTALGWLGIDRSQRGNYHWSDTGNANRLADTYGDELLYCNELKTYYVWTGKVWKRDAFVETEKRAEKATLQAFGDAKNITDGEKRKAHLNFVNKSLSRSALANMIHLAKKKVPQVSVNDFDSDPWTLNVENGTVDLRTGLLGPHDPKHLLAKMIPIRFDPDARCPQFMAFLFRARPGNSWVSQERLSAGRGTDGEAER